MANEGRRMAILVCVEWRGRGRGGGAATRFQPSPVEKGKAIKARWLLGTLQNRSSLIHGHAFVIF